MQSIITLKEGLLLLNRGPICVSPISIWEIMSTPDLERRDRLVYTCQLLFDDISVFPSPTNIMDHFISEGCPAKESDFRFFEYNTPFSVVWKDIATNLSKTLVPSVETNTGDKQLMSRFSKLLRSLIKNSYQPIDNHPDEHYNWICHTITYVHDRVPFICEDNAKGQLTPELSILYKTAIFFAVTLLIIGVDLDGQDQIEFWKKRNICDDIESQLKYLFKDNETILHRGPLVYMAKMALHQSSVSSNRGLYKDCFHATYLPYCDIFFTHDNHFSSWEDSLMHPLLGRIVNIEVFIKTFNNATSTTRT